MHLSGSCIPVIVLQLSFLYFSLENASVLVCDKHFKRLYLEVISKFKSKKNENNAYMLFT